VDTIRIFLLNSRRAGPEPSGLGARWMFKKGLLFWLPSSSKISRPTPIANCRFDSPERISRTDHSKGSLDRKRLSNEALRRGSRTDLSILGSFICNWPACGRGGGVSEVNHHSQSHHSSGSLLGILSAGFVQSIHLLQGTGLIPVWLEWQY
jgi:hypothetical protein